MKRYRMCECWNGITVFVEDGIQRNTMRDPTVNPPRALPRTMSKSETFSHKIVKLPSECCQRS